MEGKNAKSTVNKPAREPDAETKAALPPLLLDKVTPPGQLVLAPGSSRRNLEAAAKFETGDEFVRNTLFNREKNSVAKAGGTALPVSAADLYLARLETLKALLSSKRTGDKFKDVVKAARKSVAAALEGNLKTVMTEQRQVEQAWRELDAFIKLARKDEGTAVPLKVANVSVKDVCKDDAKFKQLSDAIPKSSALSMRGMVALLVLPGWVLTNTLLQKFGEMAVRAKLLVVGGVPEDMEEVQGLFGEGGSMSDAVAGNARWQQQVILVGNNICVRERHPDYEDKNARPVTISAAAVLAAQIVKGDDTISLAEAQAGSAREILLEGDNIQLCWQLDNTEIIAKVTGSRVIPAAKQGNKLVFWGVNTLYEVAEDDPNYYFGQYPVVRVRDYIEKVLIEFLNNKQLFRQNTQSLRDELKDTITKFLQDNSGDDDDTKMLNGGECIHVESGNQTMLDIAVSLVFKVALENVTIEVKAKQQRGNWEQIAGS